MSEKRFDVKVETHEYNNKTYSDLVCYFRDKNGSEKRFVLVPLSTTKKTQAYFYSLLNGTNNK